MFRSSSLLGSFLILFHVSVVSAIGLQSADTFTDSRDQISKWASGFVAKKRASITGFAKPEVPFRGLYHYVDERVIFGKTAHHEECALHLGKRLESADWIFNFYLANRKREVESVSMIQENLGFGDGVVLFEGAMVVQSQPTVSNSEAVISLDLHTTVTSISLLSLEVYPSGALGEESLSIVLDDENNIIQVTYRFTNSVRIRDGRRVDPVTCYFYYVS